MTHSSQKIAKNPDEQFQQQVRGNNLNNSLAIVAFVLLYLFVDVQNGDECWNVPENDKFFEAMTFEEPVKFKNPNILRQPERYKTTIWQALEEERRTGLLEYNNQEATSVRLRQLFDELMKPRLVERRLRADGHSYRMRIQNGFLDRDIIQENKTRRRVDMEKVCILIRRVDTSKEKADFSISFDQIERL